MSNERQTFETEEVSLKASDGTLLTTLIYHPNVSQSAPTLLQRTCYGRKIMADIFGVWFANRGYRVVFQDCRGTGNSGGEMDYFKEATDGRLTADWIASQPWFDGALGTFGESYMGFTQYALASTNPPYLKAMAIAMAAADRRSTWYPGNSFSVELCLIYWWSQAFGLSEDGWINDRERGEAKLAKALMTLPLRIADEVAVGKAVKWYRAQLEHASPEDRYWEPLNAAPSLPVSEVPTLLIGGWYDLVAPPMIRDFQQLLRGPAPCRLVMGPWTHMSRVMENDHEESNRQMLAWFDTHLRKKEKPRRSSVSLYLMPNVGWTDVPAWPPLGTVQDWHLQPKAGLSRRVARESSPDSFTYDPADPTPTAGGISVRHEKSGPADNRAIESRSDVVTYSSDPLPEDVDVVGSIRARIYVEADVGNFDLFVRVCDVHPDGRSMNVSEGLLRHQMQRQDTPHRIEFDLWPTAYRFAAGHRFRVQVSGGCHPVYARNTCSGEALGDAVTITLAHLKIHHDSRYSSVVALPVTTQLSALQPKKSQDGA
jgi:putative CocE/NonD family hydrolase